MIVSHDGSDTIIKPVYFYEFNDIARLYWHQLKERCCIGMINHVLEEKNETTVIGDGGGGKV